MSFLLDAFLEKREIDRPDGRPLYRYEMSPEEFAEARSSAIAQIRVVPENPKCAALFCLLTAEWFRSVYAGGSWSWDGVQKLLEIDNQSLCRDLAERGLRWWRRPLYRGQRRHFLLTLAAEGGIPSRLLGVGGDRFRRFLERVVDDVSAYGLDDPETVARYAASHDERLPAAFRREPVHLVVADLALWIHGARAAIPAEARSTEPLRWLELNRRDLLRDLPLRLADETARALLREELRRMPQAAGASGQLAIRMLEVAERGLRPGVIIPREVELEQRGPMAGLISILQDGDLLSARLRPAGALGLVARDLTIALMRGEGNLWSATRRSGREWLAPVPLSAAVEMEVTASGRGHGFVELLPGLVGEEAQIWREPVGSTEGPLRVELVRSRRVRTRRERLFLTTEGGCEPVVEGDLSCSLKTEAAEGTRLWEVSGAGRISAGETHLDVRTGAETEEAPEIWPVGRIAREIRTVGGRPVMLGAPSVHVSRPGGLLRPVRSEDLRWRPAGRGQWRSWRAEPPILGQIDVRALSNDEPVAETCVGILPETARIEARHSERAGAVLALSGLAPVGQAVVRMSGSEQRIPLVEGNGEAVLERDPSDGTGAIHISLSAIGPGAAPLDLVVPYPRRRAWFVQPSGRFAETGARVATSRLAGWRAVSPAGSRAELRLDFGGKGAPGFTIYRPFEGELPLFEVAEEIEGIMSLTGPDTDVHLKVIAGGRETPKYLLGSRYDGALARSAGGQYVMLDNGTDDFMEQILDGGIRLQAFHMLAPDLTQELGTWNPLREPRFDVSRLGAFDRGPWLIAADPAERSVLRPVAVAFDGAPLASVPRLSGAFIDASRQPTRDGRVAAFAAVLLELIEGGNEGDWALIGRLIGQARASAVLPSLDLVQAIARAPTAACMLLLRAPEAAVDDVLALDRAAPIFWPAVPVRSWVQAVSQTRRRLVEKLGRAFPQEEAAVLGARETLDQAAALARRMPEIGAHLARALLENDLPPGDIMTRFSTYRSNQPRAELRHVMDEAVKRNGDAAGMVPWRVPQDLPGHELIMQFHERCHRLLAAPLIVALGAVGKGLGLRELLDQRLLALQDREYFGRAMPLALQICMESVGGS